MLRIHNCIVENTEEWSELKREELGFIKKEKERRTFSRQNTNSGLK